MVGARQVPAWQGERESYAGVAVAACEAALLRWRASGLASPRGARAWRCQVAACTAWGAGGLGGALWGSHEPWDVLSRMA